MKTGEYTARNEARRAELLAEEPEDLVRPTLDYSALLTDYEQVIEDRVEQEILDQFGGHTSMVETFEAELVEEASMTVAEAIVHLRSLAVEKHSSRLLAPELLDLCAVTKRTQWVTAGAASTWRCMC